MEIQNWYELDNDQRKMAIEQLKNAGMEYTIPQHPASIHFNEFKWVKIDNFISKEMADILYHHVKLSALRASYVDENTTFDKPFIEHYFGHFKDIQAMGDYSRYSDPIFETLLDLSTPKISELVGKELFPTYSYNRLYTTGTELERHIDRESCDYSVTMCLGYDVSNIDENVYPDYDWPMFVDTDLDGNGNKPFPVHLKPGDLLIYRGSTVEHWREPFWGKNHAQVFMHYNIKGETVSSNLYDSRPVIGLPFPFRVGEIVR